MALGFGFKMHYYSGIGFKNLNSFSLFGHGIMMGFWMSIWMGVSALLVRFIEQFLGWIV